MFPAVSIRITKSMALWEKCDFHLGDKNTLNGKYYFGTHSGLVVNNQTITQPYWRPTDKAMGSFFRSAVGLREEFCDGQHVPIWVQPLLPDV